MNSQGSKFEAESLEWGIPIQLRFALQDRIQEQSRLEKQRRAGRAIVDFEPSPEDVFRNRVADILCANALNTKASRYLTCCEFGFVVECLGEDRHRYYTVSYCDLRFCSRCGARTFKRLYARHAPVLDYIKRNTRPNYRLRQITLTSKNTGELSSRQIKAFNLNVKEALNVLMEGVDSWGAIWVNEVGFDNTNLHAHVLLYSPYLPQQRLSEVWNEISGNSVVWISRTRVSGPTALRYMLKYVAKPPSDDPDIIGALEVAFHGTRRVHTVGFFYNFSKRAQDGEDSVWKSCPKCGASLKRILTECSVLELISRGLQFIGDCRQEGKKREWVN